MAVLEENRVADSTGATLTVPPGTLISHCTNTAPSGFLKANGASLSTTTYATLFAVIGYSFGGSGASFTLPDLRGEFIRGLDDGRGIDTSRVLGSAQAQSYESHNHGVTDPGHFHSFGNPIPPSFADTDRGGGSSSFSVDSTIVPNTAAAATGISINFNGSTETRPRNIALLYCIKY